MSSSIPAESTRFGRRGLQENARDHSDALVGERRGDPLQELGLADDVVVHEHENVALELECGPVDRGAETEVPLVANDVHLGMQLGDRLGGAVRRGVVDDDNRRRYGLPVEARKGLQQPLAPVECGDDDPGLHYG